MENSEQQSFSNMSAYDLIKSLSSKERVSLQRNYSKNALMLRSGAQLSLKSPKISILLKSLYNFVEEKNYRKGRLPFKKVLLLMVSHFEFLSGKPPNSLEDKEWGLISSMMPNSNAYLLKYKWFTYLKPSLTRAKWLQLQDDCLISLLHQYYPFLFEKKDQNSNSNRVNWSHIAYELNRTTSNAIFFKNYNKCKERWNNHLNPFLKKKKWSFEEDVQLLEQSLIHPKKWSIIAKRMSGRTQHTVKNRFFVLMGNELELDRQKTRQIFKEKNLQGFIERALETLYQKHNGKKKENLEVSAEFDDNKEEFLDISFENAINFLFGTKENDGKDHFSSLLELIL